MENTAKNFALQLGSLITLYVSIVALIVLLFGLITVSFPDAGDDAWMYESAVSSMRFGIALLVVFFPAYAVLTRMVNTIRRKEDGTYLKLTKWLIYLSLLVGGAALLGDLVSIIYTYLMGDVALRFILKALAFFTVVGLAFAYYLFDVRGYWQAHERESVQYGAGAGVFVVIALIAAFMNIETPAATREMRIDEQQINDLMQIQNTVIGYYALTRTLPQDMAVAYEQSGVDAPTAPQGRAAYEYHILALDTFELCATFSQQTPESQRLSYPTYSSPDAILKNSDNWTHGSGTHCFVRLINPAGIY